jgi:hypothetical protein
MAVDQQGCTRSKKGRHGGRVLRIGPDEGEAGPEGSVAFGFGLELAQETFPELENVDDLHGSDDGPGGSAGGSVSRTLSNSSSLGDRMEAHLLTSAESSKSRMEMLEGENFVHAFDAETRLAIEGVGNVGLFKSSLPGETDSGKFCCLDAFPQDFAKIIFQILNFIGRSIAPGCSVQTPDSRMVHASFEKCAERAD